MYNNVGFRVEGCQLFYRVSLRTSGLLFGAPGFEFWHVGFRVRGLP